MNFISNYTGKKLEVNTVTYVLTDSVFFVSQKDERYKRIGYNVDVRHTAPRMIVKVYFVTVFFYCTNSEHFLVYGLSP